MMDDKKSKILYSKIANKANELIPVKWDKVLLNAEVEPGVVTSYYCFYETKSGKLVEFGDIPQKYGMESSVFKYSQLELTKLIRELNAECNNSQARWTIITFSLENNGEFNVDYGYEDLSETDVTYRREQWEKKYLKM